MKARRNLVVAGGVLSILWGVFHVLAFSPMGLSRDPAALEDLVTAGLADLPGESARQLIDLFTLFNNALIVYMVGIGVVTIITAKTLADTRLGQGLLVTQAVFWAVRLVAPLVQQAREGVALGLSEALGVTIFLVMVLVYALPLVVGRQSAKQG